MKDQITGFVTHAMRLVKTKWTLTWHTLTPFISRKMPTNAEEIQRFKHILVFGFHLPDEPSTWAVVFNGLQNIKKTKLTFTYREVVNPAKRLTIDGLAETQKRLAYREIEDTLKKNEPEIIQPLPADVRDWSHDLQGDVPPLPLAES